MPTASITIEVTSNQFSGIANLYTTRHTTPKSRIITPKYFNTDFICNALNNLRVQNYKIFLNYANIFAFLSHKPVKSTRKRANEPFQLQHRQFRRHSFVGQRGFHHHEIDVQSVLGFLQFVEQHLLHVRQLA